MLFNNFTYRRCITSDVVERKSFAERIIALLLSVEAIQASLEFESYTLLCCLKKCLSFQIVFVVNCSIFCIKGC